MTTKTKARTTRPTRDRDAEIKEAHDTIFAEVSKITSDAEWRRWLDVMVKFHKYSFNNTILAYVQCAQRGMQPPTRLAGYGTWQSVNRQVRKGERGLRIFAPLAVKIKPGEQGYVAGENRTKVVGFKIVSTFDVQQTDGDPLPDVNTGGDPIEGDAPRELWDAMVKIADANGYTVRWGSTKPAEGWTDGTRREIAIDSSHDAPGAFAAAVRTLAHEIAHMLLHTDTDEHGAPTFDYRNHRGMAETEAESIAYVVCRYFGVDAGASTSFHYVAGWAKTPELVVQTGQRVQSTAKKIITKMEEIIG